MSRDCLFLVCWWISTVDYMPSRGFDVHIQIQIQNRAIWGRRQDICNSVFESISCPTEFLGSLSLYLFIIKYWNSSFRIAFLIPLNPALYIDRINTLAVLRFHVDVLCRYPANSLVIRWSVWTHFYRITLLPSDNWVSEK